MLTRLAHQLFRFEAEETTGERIFFRVLEVFIVGYVIWFCWQWGVYIPTLNTVAIPAGIARYIDLSFMFSNNISIYVAVLITGLCVLGVLRLWRPAYFVALLHLHLQYVARYSLGKTPHGANYIGMSLMALALAFLLFNTPKLRRRFALGFIYFFVGLGYTIAAFSKLIGTGLDWPAGRHLWLWIAEKKMDMFSLYGTFEPNFLQEMVLNHQALGTMMLGFGLLMELCGVLMWWPRFRYFIIPALIGFHLGIAFTMNIFFDVYTYELVLLGFPWAVWIDRLLVRMDTPAAARLHNARLLAS